MRFRIPRASLVAIGTAALVLPPAAAHAAAPTKTYVVQLKAPPLAGYAGGRRGLAATSPAATGASKLNTRSAAAVAYRAFLDRSQDNALARVPGAAPKVDYTYRTAYSGFAAELTQAQVASLRNSPQVAQVVPDRRLKVTTTPAAANGLLDGASNPFIGDTAAYLGLTGAGGLWPNPVENGGRGVIVGVLDTGITPQHPSFAGNGFTAPPPSKNWLGTCDTGNDATFQCNNKLIGARFFVQGFGLTHIAPDSFVSPRDDDGHGTHTASTAAGDFGVNPDIQGRQLGVNEISGIAPGAWVAAYKICWVGGDVADGCLTSDSVAAIDRAVADGVDVINYSVGSSTADLIDPVEVAFLNASAAGVFVANSAGNDGPDPGTVGTPTSAPWLTSVAASSEARTFLGSATISNGVGTISGSSVTAALPTGRTIVDAADAPATGQTVADAERCFPGALSSAAVTGKVVLCKRGVNPRIEKSQVVKDAGGVGMILYNPVPNQDTETDIHFVPTIHVDNAEGLAVKNAIHNGGATVTASTAGTAQHWAPRVLAAFSSRGPQLPAPDISKPDVSAPGVNILAGNTPQPSANTGLPGGELYQSISGTSMSGPQVAGAGALLTQAHPDWSPAEIKSALMTTATPVVLEDGATAAPPFAGGSGEINPSRAADPGLVLDVATNDYARYIDSLDPNILGDGQAPIQAADLNLPSLAMSKVPGTFSTTRSVTSVLGGGDHWTASIDVPGFDASVSPNAFDIASGATQQLTISGQATSAPLDQYSFGALTLTDGTRTLRLPVSLRPIAIGAPATVKVNADRSAGTATIPLKSGLNGTITALGFGLAAPNTRAGEQIQTDPNGTPDPSAASPSMKFYDVDVPAGAQLLSGRISNADGDADPNTDLDLYLFRDANGDGNFTPDELVDQSASAIADEGVTEVQPDGGRYRFVVVGFATHGPSSYDFTTWVDNDATPDDTSGGPGISVTGDPFATSIGQSLNATLNYAGVDRKGLYLGLATFHDGASATKDNQKTSSVIELTKTADTTSAAAGGAAGKPTAGTSKSKPKVIALSLSRLKARLRRGTLILTMTLSRRSTITVRVLRGKHRVYRASRRRAAAGRHTLRFKVGKRMRGRRLYRITVTASVGSKHVRRTLRFRVR